MRVRVVSLSTKEMSEIARFEKRSSGSRYLKYTNNPDILLKVSAQVSL